MNLSRATLPKIVPSIAESVRNGALALFGRKTGQLNGINSNARKAGKQTPLISARMAPQLQRLFPFTMQLRGGVMIRKKILFATDFSTRDREAFQLACRLAAAWRNKLLIVHVEESDEPRSFAPRLDPIRELYHLYPKNIEIDFEHILRHGDPADAILEIEHNQNVGLIVVGTHGRKGIERVFSGSVAEKVIRDADCPVLTMREHRPPPVDETSDSSKLKILVPVDFSVHSYAALDYASSLAKTLEANMTILYVDETTNPVKDRFPHDRPEWSDNIDEIWEQLKKVKPKWPHISFGHKLLQGPAADNITGLANQQDYDFIVLGTHGRTGIGRVLMGSVAEKVVRTADCAVVTVKPSNKPNPVLRH